MSSEPEKTCHLCKYRNIPEGAGPCAECLSEGEEDKWEPGEPVPDPLALLVRCKLVIADLKKSLQSFCNEFACKNCPVFNKDNSQNPSCPFSQISADSTALLADIAKTEAGRCG